MIKSQGVDLGFKKFKEETSHFINELIKTTISSIKNVKVKTMNNFFKKTPQTMQYKRS